jgi:hypothetical protein
VAEGDRHGTHGRDDVYGALGDKIDSLTVRAQTEAFHAMLRELYSPEEAELIVKMFTLARSSGSRRRWIRRN